LASQPGANREGQQTLTNLTDQFGQRYAHLLRHGAGSCRARYRVVVPLVVPSKIILSVMPPVFAGQRVWGKLLADLSGRGRAAHTRD
jgi:hypothetical protein